MKNIPERGKKPAVKSVFYDDFSEGIRGDVWRALNERWKSQNNNGYSEDNCMFTTDPEAVAAEGATGGLVIIASNGDFAREEGRKRQGGGIVTKRLFGPGRYEVRMKAVPRAGQCSACWTYFNDWSLEYESRKYSEIDIEMPHGGDFRRYSGTTYENYASDSQKNCASEVISCPPVNDGKWHVFAFEWRTAGEDGESVTWLLDGVPRLKITRAVPRYTATFWVASLFQDAIAWLGDPLFERAYLYLDWVRITEYDEPCLDGNNEAENRLSYTGRYLGSSPVPHTDYFANGDFSRPACVKSFKGREICSWQLSDGAEIADGRLVLKAGASASQTVTAQYAGFAFELTAVCGGANDGLRVRVDCLKGAANCSEPALALLGSAEYAAERSGDRAVVRFTVGERETEHIRVTLCADGRELILTECHLKLVS